MKLPKYSWMWGCCIRKTKRVAEPANAEVSHGGDETR